MLTLPTTSPHRALPSAVRPDHRGPGARPLAALQDRDVGCALARLQPLALAAGLSEKCDQVPHPPGRLSSSTTAKRPSGTCAMPCPARWRRSARRDFSARLSNCRGTSARLLKTVPVPPRTGTAVFCLRPVFVVATIFDQTFPCVGGRYPMAVSILQIDLDV